MKVMFLDESGDHSLTKIDNSYPMFVLGGCIFDLDDYTKSVEKRIDELKLKYFGRTNVILRSYDIRKQKNDFSILVHKPTRESFLNDIGDCLQSIDFTIIAAAINKKSLLNQYTKPSNPYDLCFWFILERAVMYLGSSGEQIIFRAESRETHNDKQLAAIYEHFRSHGTKHSITSEEAKSKFLDLSFNQKSQNIAGHQIADLISYPIGKWVLDSRQENPAFDRIKNKIHQKHGVITNIGLKVFPNKIKGAQESPSPLTK